MKGIIISLCLLIAGRCYSGTPTDTTAPQIHVQFDRSVYVAGDTIWFKSYVLSNLQPDLNCKNLYVDVVDIDDSLVLSGRFPIIGGTGTGNLILPLNLPGGMYIAKAYTPSQLNHGARFVFFQSLAILNPYVFSSKKLKSSLPSNSLVSTNGFDINIENHIKGKLFTIEGYSNEKGLTITGYMFGEKVFEQHVTEHLKKGIIPTKELPSGVLELRVTNAQENLARKLTFINNKEYLLSVDIREIDLPDGSKSLSFAFPDTVSGHFSLSITDADKDILLSDGRNLISDILVGPFADYVNVPLSHFFSDSAQAIDRLLNLRYKTEELVQPETRSQSVMEQQFLTISGRVLENDKPLKKAELLLMFQTNDSSTGIITAPVSNGRFVVEDLIFEDTATFFYQVKRSKAARLEVDSPLRLRRPVGYPVGLLSDTDSMLFRSKASSVASKIYEYNLNSAQRSKMLEEVIIVTRKQSPTAQVNKKYTTGVFANSNMAKTLDFINAPPASFGSNIFDYLQGRMAGLRITRKSGLQYDLYSPRAVSLTGGLIPVKVFLNEIEQEQTSFVASIPLDHIALVKYFTPGYIPLPGVGLSPVLAIYTKQPENVKPSGFIDKFKYVGYTPTFEFFSPLLDPAVMSEHKITLLWQADILIEEAKEYVLQLKNESPKNLRIRFKGITTDGKLIDSEKIIKGG